jgi:Mn2+/Fe2+ NRAMP family transporter
MTEEKLKNTGGSFKGAFLGAAFLMATSAIGPGFLTQTTKFTAELYASFGFVILISILLDIGAQLNIWRIITASEKRAPDIANQIFPGLGYLLSALIVIGGIAFNAGNIAGCGMGLNVLFGIDIKTGAAISAVIAIAIFWIRDAGVAMDWFAKILGFIMIGLTFYVAFTSHPPLADALVKSFVPDKINISTIVTIVGGTVGGYITFAGAHRLLDANIKGIDAIPKVSRSAVTAIGLASVMRILLFLAALGVVMQGITLNADNPAATVFQTAAGNIGFKIFGIVIWAAAITSVVGASYTSVSFIRSFHKGIEKNNKSIITAFIILSAGIFIIIGRPVKTLVFVGALNGMILPVALGTMLIAAHNKKIIGKYKHPFALTAFGIIVTAAMTWMGIKTMIAELGKLF